MSSPETRSFKHRTPVRGREEADTLARESGHWVMRAKRREWHPCPSEKTRTACFLSLLSATVGRVISHSKHTVQDEVLTLTILR